MASAISFQTFLDLDIDPDLLELQALNEFIEEKFPEVHTCDWITFNQVNGRSRLYRIQGSEEDVVNPYLLTAHLDVVPAGMDLVKMELIDANV